MLCHFLPDCFLADVIPCEQPQLTDAVAESIHVVGHTQDVIIVSTRSLEDAKEADPAIATTLSPWIRRGTLRWINVSGRELDRWVVRTSRGVAVDPQRKATAPRETNRVETTR